MSLGIISILVAAVAAVWLLLRMARADVPGGEKKNDLIFRGVIFLALVAALAAAKLWPLAFMVLIAAGAVTGIEIWRSRAIALTESMAAPAPTRSVMKPEEAASILGVEEGASPADIRAAHRKLISQLHPDKGGTDYLAAKINDARKVLLKQAETAPTIEPSDSA